MRLLELTLPTPAENIALDEALLDEAEATGDIEGTLRLWESPQPIVVIGRSSKIAEEVNLDVCRAEGIEVLRRASGGAAIVAGPGCLMYAVVLSYSAHPQLQHIDQAHEFVLGRLRAGLLPHFPDIEMAGISDLSRCGKKFSGNSLRCKRTHILYHGTLLYDFPLDLVPRVLGTPPRQPEYRAKRSHGEFVCNLPIGREELRQSVLAGWNCEEVRPDWPKEVTRRLVVDRYGADEWNSRL